MRFLNDPAPWWGLMSGPALSLADLVGNGTVPAVEAAALGWAVERGASVFVAAGPRLAGKSTLATALFGFLPPDARAYVTAGPRDPLAVPLDGPPTYLLINELSNHTPFYLAGPAARRAFRLLGEGARLIGTLHADSAAEAVEVMRRESGIPLGDIARLTLVAVLRARRRGPEVERRVVEIGLLRPAGERVAVGAIAAWDAAADRLAIVPPPDGLAALAAWAERPAGEVERAVAARAALLVELARGGRRTNDEVAAALTRLRAAEASGGSPPPEGEG